MRMGYETSSTAPVILLLSVGPWLIYSASVPGNLPRANPLGLDFGPAPSPEDGPPLSASASRDPALLPAQIGGIIGAYLFIVCVVGIVLLCVGRKLRQEVLYTHNRNFDIELVQPTKLAYATDPSPISPGGIANGARNFSWPSPEKTDRNPYIFPSTNQSPITPPGRDPYVDNHIVEADREMLQRDLEDLYAHVMEQEEAKAAGVKIEEMPPPPGLKKGVGSSSPTSPQKPFSSSKKAEKSRPANINTEETKSIRSRTSSIMSALKSPRKKGVRAMEISSPLPTPSSGTFPKHDHTGSDLEPLAPRYYSPPPPPPVPTDQVPYQHSRNTSSVGPGSPNRSIAEQLGPYGQSNYRSHRANPSQTSVQSSNRGDLSATSATSQTPLYPPPKIQTTLPKPTGSNPPSNSNATRALPFRQFDPPLASPSFVSSTTKTTVLERTNRDNGPTTSGLKTPWSAGAVPYSPYQPFSPIMPITPRLVTKEDRKAAKKAEKRAPATELIKSEDELWDSGY